MSTINSQPKRTRWLRWFFAVVFLVSSGSGVAYWQTEGRLGVPHAAAADQAAPPAAMTVEVIQPKQGGIERLCVQPGTVEPFESAELYAKASGFLVEQTVDIGSRVKKGDILARISVPEYVKQVQRDVARVKNANAKVKQMEAHVAAAKSEAKAADAAVSLAKVLVLAKTSYRQYREKQLKRFKELAKERAIEARVVDEQEDFYLSSVEAENAAKEGINTAIERAVTTRARIDQAMADLDEAKAGVEVAQAECERSQVLLDYAIIKSPYTGVVTRRTLHVGDFVKSADQGGATPLFAVERTDVMRVIVRVPDRDIPYVSLGDPAVVEIDALPGFMLESKGPNRVSVSRWAESEDPQSRTMRTEVDVPNADGRLRHGMYGRVSLKLSEGTPNSVRIPSSALSGKAEGGRGMVRVVKDNKAMAVSVRYANDNGIEAEIVSGLTAADLVIIRANGPIEDGTAVSIGTSTSPTSH